MANGVLGGASVLRTCIAAYLDPDQLKCISQRSEMNCAASVVSNMFSSNVYPVLHRS